MKNNKKEMRLMKVISDIPDDMITSAANEKTKKPWYKNFAVLGTAAACICAVAVGGILLAMNGQGGYPIKYIYLDADDITTSMDSAYVPKWHERTIEEQYRTLTLSKETYGSRCTEIDPSLVAEKIASAASLSVFFLRLASPLAIPPKRAISLCSSFVRSLCGIRLSCPGLATFPPPLF